MNFRLAPFRCFVFGFLFWFSCCCLFRLVGCLFLCLLFCVGSLLFSLAIIAYSLSVCLQCFCASGGAQKTTAPKKRKKKKDENKRNKEVKNEESILRGIVATNLELFIESGVKKSFLMC